MILFIFCFLLGDLRSKTNYIFHYTDLDPKIPAIIQEQDFIKEEIIIKPKLNLIERPKKKAKEKPKEEKISEEKAEYLTAKELFNKGVYQEAITLFNQYLNKYKAGAFRINSIILLGDINFILKNYSESIRYYNQVLQEKAEEKHKAEAMLKLAKSYFENNEIDKSISTASMLTKLYSHINFAIDGLIFLGNAYRKKEEPLKAIEEYQKAIVKYKNNQKIDEAWFLLGDTYENEPEVRDLSKAVECYNKIIKYYPESLFYKEAQERIEFLNKNFFLKK